MTYEVTKKHQTNYPDPLTLEKGEQVIIDHEYDDENEWNNWVYCFKIDKSQEGWVPEHLIDRKFNHGIVRDSYTAKELSVDIGERLEGIKEMNGWIWVRRLSDDEEGWVPLKNLEISESE